MHPYETDYEVTELAPGSLLLADPSLHDPNFTRTVILLCAYAEEDGALGVILNRPTEKTLGELYLPFSKTDLADVPVFLGGPVDPNQLLLAAWRWQPGPSPVFKLHFGITAEKAKQLHLSGEGFQVRAFLGYTGWSGGQLEAEVDEGSWLKAPIRPSIENSVGQALWKRLVGSLGVHYRLLIEAPEDPSLN